MTILSPMRMLVLAALAAMSDCSSDPGPERGPGAQADGGSDAGTDSGQTVDDLTATGESWPEADGLFRQDPRWLGSDAAYSVDLGGDRTLWLFGDTFVATSPANVRTAAALVRNTIGVQVGRDPTTATMTFAWGSAGGAPASFIPELGSGDGLRWHWPLGGARLPDGSVIVFLSVEKATPGVGLGFANDGWRAAHLSNLDLPPSTWQVEMMEPPAQALGARVGTAVAIDGDHLLALSASDDNPPVGYLARFPLASLASSDLGAIEWWNGAAWVTPALLTGAPASVIPVTGPEASLHFDPATRRWIHIASTGFGATTVGLSSALHVTGSWSSVQSVFTPPESRGPKAFVYAAKAHPEQSADGALAVTYATNSFTFADLLTPDGTQDLYWPRFARLTLTPR